MHDESQQFSPASRRQPVKRKTHSGDVTLPLWQGEAALRRMQSKEMERSDKMSHDKLSVIRQDGRR